eukprot:NODE_18682_length_881_cov_7.417772.p2 GENE.NODE_18682_length_881_cov_7.417772~~NODE_18682_length_881_cov_7.417772.p2  ORF type:complete len:184 (-),score=51.21 NODE_18682_length_881_cov_7.417772:265-816(-)
MGPATARYPYPRFISMLSRRITALVGRTVIRRAVPAAPLGRRAFSEYEGQPVTDEQLVKGSEWVVEEKSYALGHEGEATFKERVKKDADWAIEETNFCLGRQGMVRYKETDDLARRTQHLMNCQLNRQHTRLRDGTVIPYTALYLDQMIDKPGPAHIFTELPLLKWTWDETYDEAYEKPETAE